MPNHQTYYAATWKVYSLFSAAVSIQPTDLWQDLLVDLGCDRDDDRHRQAKIDWSLNALAKTMRRHVNNCLLTAMLKRIGNMRNQVIFNWYRQTTNARLVCDFGIIGCRGNCRGISCENRYFIVTTATTQCRGFATRASWAAAGIFHVSIWYTVKCFYLTQNSRSCRQVTGTDWCHGQWTCIRIK